MMDPKDEIAAVLTEYGAIRKEIDDRLSTFQVRGLPLLLAVAGFTLGWQGKFPFDFALFMAPFVGLILVSLSFNSWFYIYRAGRWLAAAEDKVFRLSDVPLLTHETELVYQRQTEGNLRKLRWPGAGLALVIAYPTLECLLYKQLSDPIKQTITSHFIRWSFFIIVLTVPLVRIVFDSIQIYRLCTSDFSSSLLEFMRKNPNELRRRTALR